MRGRRRYKFVMSYLHEVESASMLQRAYRGRRGRRKSDARRRFLLNQKSVTQSRSTQASILRLFLLRHRKQQRTVLKRLVKYGFDPVSFITKTSLEVIY